MFSLLAHVRCHTNTIQKSYWRRGKLAGRGWGNLAARQLMDRLKWKDTTPSKLTVVRSIRS